MTTTETTPEPATDEQLLEIEELACDFEPDLVGYRPADAEEASALIGRLEAERERFNGAYDDYRAGVLS